MSDSSRPSHGRALVSALIVTVLWSVSWILIREGLDDEGLEPLGFAALRYGIAAVVLGAAALYRPATRAALLAATRADWLRICLLGVVFYAVTQGAQFIAIDNQPASTTSLVLSLTPLLVAGASGRSLAESARPRQWIGAGLVAAGAWAYFSGDLGATALGMTAALVALAANVTSSLMGRSINRSGALSPLAVTAASMVFGSVILVVAGVAAEGVQQPTGRGWVIIVWLAVVHTALAFTLWNHSLRRLTAVESAAINNTMLIQIAALAWIFLAEEPGPGGIIGIVIVSAGVFLAGVTIPLGRSEPQTPVGPA